MKIGIVEAFRRYNATLKNANWSVSAWSGETALVVSLWDHHRMEDPPPDTLAFRDTFSRWSGPGNSEFRANVLCAFEQGATVHLVLVRTLEFQRVQAGEDASKIPKTFAVRDDLIGRVADIQGDSYIIEFKKASTRHPL